MSKANLDIRRAAQENGIKMWQIADRIGICDVTFCKWMRKELPTEKKKTIFNAIEELKEGAV